MAGLASRVDVDVSRSLVMSVVVAGDRDTGTRHTWICIVHDGAGLSVPVRFQDCLL